MFIEKKISIEFENEEKNVIQKMIDLYKTFEEEDICRHLSCCDCPFEKLCNANYETAEEFIEDLNESIQD